MSKRLTFRQMLTQAAQVVPGLVDDDGEVKISRVAAYTKARGHAVSQPTLFRHYNAPPDKPLKMEEHTIGALHLVFGLPKSMLRNEPMDARTEDALDGYPLSTILLAKRIEALPPALRRSVVSHIEELLRREEEHHRAHPSADVTHLPRRP